MVTADATLVKTNKRKQALLAHSVSANSAGSKPSRPSVSRERGMATQETGGPVEGAGRGGCSALTGLHRKQKHKVTDTPGIYSVPPNITRLQ